MNSLLIVEDEKMIRKGLRVMVERSPVEVGEILERRNGEEALALLRERPVDAMITDIRMPKMDGIELVRSLSALPTPPITVVVSGFDDFSYAVEMLREGVRDYILKPVDQRQFYDVLAKMDEEFQARGRAQHNDFQIGQQILRAVLLSEELSEAEMAAILEEYGDRFFGEPYTVVCLANQALPVPLPADVICLRDIQSCQTLLLPHRLLEDTLSLLDGCCAGYSSPHQGLDTLRGAYGEARRARGLAYAVGKHRGCGDSPPAAESVDIQKELVQVVQLLGTSNAPETKKLLGKILLYTQTGRLAPAEFTTAMADLVSMISAAYRMMLSSTDELELFGNPWAYHSAFDYYTALCAWCDSFCRSLTEEFEDFQNKQKIQEATQYIQENYRKSINMAMVSNHVSMNYSLFSYLFKQYTGTNFVNYLRNLRIEKSRELLVSTDLRVLEISAQVGFQDEKHYMKTFKTIYGVSPTEYRKNHRYGEFGG